METIEMIELIKAGQLSKLIHDLDAAIAREPANAEHYAKRAFVAARTKDRKEAARNALIACELAPEEPAYSFEASIQLAKDGRFIDAATYATLSIESSKAQSSLYYLETAYLLRAYYRAKSGRRDEAIADLSFVSDDASFYADRLVSKRLVREL